MTIGDEPCWHCLTKDDRAHIQKVIKNLKHELTSDGLPPTTRERLIDRKELLESELRENRYPSLQSIEREPRLSRKPQ